MTVFEKVVEKCAILVNFHQGISGEPKLAVESGQFQYVVGACLEFEIIEANSLLMNCFFLNITLQSRVNQGLEGCSSIVLSYNCL